MDSPPAFCVPLEREKENAWRIVPTKTGKGQFGSVWMACLHTDCSYVMKIIPLKKGFGLRSFKREVTAQKHLASRGLAVDVFDSWVCEDPKVGVIIMKVLDMTAGSFFSDLGKSTFDQEVLISSIIGLVQETHRVGYFHGDLHLGNIMLRLMPKSYQGPFAVRTSKGTFRVYLVDMGRSGALIYPGKKHTSGGRKKGDWYLLGRELKVYAKKGYPKFQKFLKEQLE